MRILDGPAETIADVRAAGRDESLIDVSTRTLRRTWAYLPMLDLQRKCTTSLKDEDAEAIIVCNWRGWSDLEMVLGYYWGTFPSEAQQRQWANSSPAQNVPIDAITRCYSGNSSEPHGLAYYNVQDIVVLVFQLLLVV
jgi:hypothetical protein